MHYGPASVENVKKAFPFRTVHFFASSDKAKRLLGWQPKHSFMADVDAVRRAGRRGGCCMHGPGSVAGDAGRRGLPRQLHRLAVRAAALPMRALIRTYLPRFPPSRPQLVKEFQASGRLDKQPDFAMDDAILAAQK